MFCIPDLKIVLYKYMILKYLKLLPLNYLQTKNYKKKVFYLGPNGMETSKISYLTCNAIASRAASFIK